MFEVDVKNVTEGRRGGGGEDQARFFTRIGGWWLVGADEAETMLPAGCRKIDYHQVMLCCCFFCVLFDLASFA